jgi:RNA polymerase sigma factor (sigma-70 family)
VARQWGAALRVATVMLGGSDGADDVAQRAAERAWRAISSVDPERGFRAWFLRAVANEARNDRRSRGRRAALALRAEGRRADEVSDPADLVVTDEERRAVLAALNRLSREDRLVLALRHFEQLSEREMADALEVPPGTVKSRLARATARLRAELQEAVTTDG